jgi:ketol-acid reductoisomerase
MIETAFREECETGLFGELVVLSADVEVRLFGQRVDGAA